MKDEDVPADDLETLLIEDKIDIIEVRLKRLISEKVNNVFSKDLTIESKVHKGIKLPEIKTPEFYGSYEELNLFNF